MTEQEIRQVFGPRVDTAAAAFTLLEAITADPSVPANYRTAARLVIDAGEIAWGPA